MSPAPLHSAQPQNHRQRKGYSRRFRFPPRLDHLAAIYTFVDLQQDLIIAAFNDALAKVNDILTQKLGSLGPGLKIPGLS